MGDERRWTDKSLGMDRRIARRDLLDGIAVPIGLIGARSAPAQSGESWRQDQPGYYPPVLQGLRGSHPGSFEGAHALRDGDFWKNQREITDTGERYDLVVVGAGISGLSAAHFYRVGRPDAKILILDNHDDFGGHAKRNEFHLGAKLHLLNGGTLEVDSPRPYSSVADGLLKDLGVDPVALSKACDRDELYPSLGLTRAIFFDRETFGQDLLVPGVPVGRQKADAGVWQAFLARTPLSPTVQRDIERIEIGPIDYMPGLSSEQKKDHLSRISYRDYLLKIAQVDPAVIPFYQTATQGEWGVGINAVSALDCWVSGCPDFKG
jgi:spermidine dehydrogenase